MSFATRAIAIAATAVLGGCVLLIDPIDTGDHCGFAGSGACAECIKTSCTAPIDACCASTDCAGSSMLGDIDACGRDEVDACLATLTSGRITKTEEAVRACASNNCKDLCTIGAKSTGATSRPKWTCATAREPVNACASCIYESCADKLDTCCATSSCKDETTIQIDVGACVSGDAKACAYSQTDARSTSGQAGVVRACIADQCKAACLGSGTTHTDCSLLNGGKYCQCSPSEVAGDQPCTANQVGGDCFETKKGCMCGVFGCTTSSSGCSCSFSGGGSPTTCEPQFGSSSSGSSSDPVCCLKLSDTSVSCECREYSTSCYADLDEYQIASCSREAVRALLNARVQSVCSR